MYFPATGGHVDRNQGTTWKPVGLVIAIVLVTCVVFLATNTRPQSRGESIAMKQNYAMEELQFCPRSLMLQRKIPTSTDAVGMFTANSQVVNVTLWQNWVRNQYYNHSSAPLKMFQPTNQKQLSDFLSGLGPNERVRVQGATHSQPPLIVHNSMSNPPTVVDMTVYRSSDMPGGMKLVGGTSLVRVNPGINETTLDNFLSQNDLSLITVTAGGFFSIGGMVSVDVHGATWRSGIFAENVVSYEIMGGDGTITTITSNDDAINYARVNMGALGVVTEVTIKCTKRRHVGAHYISTNLYSPDSFANTFVDLLQNWQRVETFFNPYVSEYGIGLWNVGMSSTPRELVINTGAGVNPLEKQLQQCAEVYQYRGMTNAQTDTGIAFLASTNAMKNAIVKKEEIWLNIKIIRAMFMSYFIPIGRLDKAGMRTAWLAMDVVTQMTTKGEKPFHIDAPMEFRFVKGGSTALSATYSDHPADEWFVNLDLIGYLKMDYPGVTYSTEFLQFFAEVEREWFLTFNGLPHHGKMFGFCKPTSGGHSAAPFNSEFLAALRERRSGRIRAFDNYRKSSVKRYEMFSSAYIEQLLSPTPSPSSSPIARVFYMSAKAVPGIGYIARCDLQYSDKGSQERLQTANIHLTGETQYLPIPSNAHSIRFHCCVVVGINNRCYRTVHTWTYSTAANRCFHLTGLLGSERGTEVSC